MPESASLRIARNAAALAVSRVIGAGLLFLWQIVLARALGAEQYGVYGTIGALMAVAAALPDMGMGVIVVREVARRPAEAGAYLAGTLVLQSLFAVAAYAVAQVAAHALGYDRAIRMLVAFVGLNLLVDVVGTMAHNQFIAAERMAWPAIVGVAHVALLVALGLAALTSGAGLWGVYTAVIVSGLARSGAYWIGLGRYGCRPVFPVDRALVGRLSRAGAPLAVAALLALGFMHADKLLTTVLVGVEGTGQLTAAFLVVFGAVEVLGSTVLVAVLPLMSRAHDRSDRSALEAVLARLVTLDLLAGVPVAGLLSAFSAEIARGVFGARFAGAGDLLRVLAWYILVAMVSGALAQTLIVGHRQTRVLWSRAGALAVNLALVLALLPRIGVLGAAVAMLAAEVAMMALLSWLLWLPRAWWAQVGGRLLRLAPAALGLWVAVAAFPQIPPAARAGAGVLCYGALVAAAGAIARDDRALLGEVMRRAPALAWRRRSGSGES